MSKINHRPDCIDHSTCDSMIRSRDEAIVAQSRLLAELQKKNDSLVQLITDEVDMRVTMQEKFEDEYRNREITKSLADALRRIIEKAEATVATIKNCSGPPAPVTATEVAMELRDIAYSALKNDKNRAVLEDLQSHLSKK